jgi:ribonuclease VapC
VLDSFALLAVYRVEEGGIRVHQLINDRASQHMMSVVNLGEVYYRVAKERDLEAADVTLAWIETLPVRLMDIDWPMAKSAALIKANYTLAYADCFAAALAQRLNARVVTGDPEFEQLERDGVIEVEWLVRKPRRRR